MNKPIMIGVLAAWVAGLFCQVIGPAVLGVVVAVLISGATLLDPLYAADRVETTWLTLKTVLIIQVLHTFISAIITGLLIGYAASRLSSSWLYPAGALLSLVIHYGLFFVFVAGLSMVSAENNTGQVWTISLVTTTLMAPLIGLMCVYVIRWRM